MTFAIAIAALAGAAMAGQAQGPATAGSQAMDARCLLATSSGTSASDPAMRNAMQMAAIFFGARLSVQVPGDRLEQVLWEQTRLMAEIDQRELVRTCGELMRQDGARMAEAARGIAARERAQTPR